MKENIKKHNLNWPQILDNPYKILVTGGSGSGKTSSLFNLQSWPKYMRQTLVLV